MKRQYFARQQQSTKKSKNVSVHKFHSRHTIYLRSVTFLMSALFPFFLRGKPLDQCVCILIIGPVCCSCLFLLLLYVLGRQLDKKVVLAPGSASK